MLNQKNVVVIGVGSIASKIVAKVKENAEYSNKLILSFIGIGLEELNKFEGLELDKKFFIRNEYVSEKVVASMRRALSEVEESVKDADYVLILAKAKSWSWIAASVVMEMLVRKEIPFGVLTKDPLPPYKLIKYIDPLAVKYNGRPITYYTNFPEPAFQKDLLAKEREVYEDLTWQSMAEAALQVMCSCKDSATGSSLFKEFLSDGGRWCFRHGLASGNDRLGIALKQAKKHLTEEFDKVFLYIKADNLQDKEVQTVKGEIAKCLKNSELIVVVSKTNCSEGFLTISLFCRRRLLSRKVVRDYLLNLERERQDVVKQRGSKE